MSNSDPHPLLTAWCSGVLHGVHMTPNPQAASLQQLCSRLIHDQSEAECSHVQLALDPIWKAYEACEPGADAKGILGRVVKGLGLHHVSISPSTTPACDGTVALVDPGAKTRQTRSICALCLFECQAYGPPEIASRHTQSREARQSYGTEIAVHHNAPLCAEDRDRDQDLH